MANEPATEPIKPLAGRRLSKPATLHKRPGPKPRLYVRRKRYTRRQNRALTEQQAIYCELRKKYPTAPKKKILQVCGYSPKTKCGTVESARFFRSTAREIEAQWSAAHKAWVRELIAGKESRFAAWKKEKVSKFGARKVKRWLKALHG
ncbi:MAG: hypothetical protein PHC61_04580 [Chitinivibrionales bacterium]|nr:hypothetical protein [Chitinivibrionales bacterium]